MISEPTPNATNSPSTGEGSPSSFNDIKEAPLSVSKITISDSDSDHIEKMFAGITDDKVISWETKLVNAGDKKRKFNLEDSDILNTGYCNDKIMRIMRGDIDRTRVVEAKCLDNFKELSLKFMSYYLKKFGFDYKQGLNEIAGPFILLRHKIEISLTRLYKMFVCFIDKFLTNYYYEKEFFSLQSSLGLINLLLKFHDPELYKIFEYSMINPEMYATSWVLTLFANKCSLEVTYHLWDKLILFDDTLMPLFFIVSYLILKRELFLKEDSSVIPSILSQLRIQDIEEVNKILDSAVDLRDKTPYSFRLYAEKLEIFKFKSSKLKELYEKFDPENLLCMPIYPSEMLRITYKDFIGCPDEFCLKFDSKQSTMEESKIEKTVKKCYHCENHINRDNVTYIILDLRTFDNLDKENKPKRKHSLKNVEMKYNFPGFLPMTIKISKEELLDVSFPKNFLQNYTAEKGKFHFVLMTNETDYFRDFEEKYYKEGAKRRPSRFGVVHKTYKELNYDKANELFKKDYNSKDSINLREFNNLKKILDGMMKQGFQYVSFVLGGYSAVHDLALKYGVELLDHGEGCFICQESNKVGIFGKMFRAIGFNKKEFSSSLPMKSKNKLKDMD